MTDWIISQGMMCRGSAHPAPQAWKIAAAGGGVVMPGSRKEAENIRKALAAGKLSRDVLEKNAAGLLKLKPNRINRSMAENGRSAFSASAYRIRKTVYDRNHQYRHDSEKQESIDNR